MGSGHSEAIKTTRLEMELFLPTPTYYEVDWWKRQVHLDGAFRSSYMHLGRNALAQYSAENMAARRGVQLAM